MGGDIFEGNKLRTLPCGYRYHDHCFIQMLGYAGSSGPMCKHANGTEDHLLDMVDIDRDMATVLNKEGVLHKLIGPSRKRNWDQHNAHCPKCNREVTLGNYCNTFSCTEVGCINPPYGYCRKCLKGIDKFPHSCETEGDEQLLQYLAEAGVHPCPSCNQGVVKAVASDCNHMSCPSCNIKYCAVCGHVFTRNLQGTHNYHHTCKSNNMYVVPREHISQVYLGRSTPSTPANATR
jgi:hypothetical protein